VKLLSGFMLKSTVRIADCLVTHPLINHSELANIKITDEEVAWLQKTCTYLTDEYFAYIQTFTFKPAEQIEFIFTPVNDRGFEADVGDITLRVKGLWLETILYEIPLLAILSEGYFKFVDTNWTYDGQKELAFNKGHALLEGGCVFSEFGTRRRRDYHTHDLVMQGLVQAQKEYTASGNEAGGKLTGTSNVHFAMKHGVQPVGTVAHEWYMGVAAIEEDYIHANENALQYWIGTFGPGVSRLLYQKATANVNQVLAIALTDTFGTRAFLDAFKEPIANDPENRSFSQVFTGVRQDSGDPVDYIQMMKKFYDDHPNQKPKNTPVIVFSDSLNVEKCIHYKEESIKAGFSPTFGVGTFFTSELCT
jgi:nicotinate phosphoribosyltransferase